jgi:hypothetical protein
VSEKKVVIRLSKNWVFRGDINCRTRADGSKVCTIRGTISRG